MTLRSNLRYCAGLSVVILTLPIWLPILLGGRALRGVRS